MSWLLLLSVAFAADLNRSAADAVGKVVSAAGRDRGSTVAVVAVPDSDDLGVLPPDLALQAAQVVEAELGRAGYTRVVGARDVARLLVAWRLSAADLSAHADLCKELASQMGVERIAWVHISNKGGTALQLALGLPADPGHFLGAAMEPL